eukprot:2778975-Prymnesium_polylepis.1
MPCLRLRLLPCLRLRFSPPLSVRELPLLSLLVSSRPPFLLGQLSLGQRQLGRPHRGSRVRRTRLFASPKR